MAKLIACAGQGVELSGVPTEIKILPLGRVHSQKGDFNVDDESFELIRKQFKDRKLDLVIDYEHQTLSDVQAPAGGWIKDLYKGEGFKGFVDKAPVVVPQGKLDLKDAPAASNSDEVDIAILKNMGVSMEDVKKYNKKED